MYISFFVGEKNILNNYNLNLETAVTFLIFVSDTKILLFWNRRSLMNAKKTVKTCRLDYHLGHIRELK